MRLTPDERLVIKEIIEEIFGPARVILFGSRLDSDKKGRDIDLFVIPANMDDLYRKKLRASAKLEMLLYKPVDIVVHRDFDRAIEKEALRGVEL